MLPETNYYYSGDQKRKIPLINSSHEDETVVVFQQCHEKINDKSLQLFVANTMCGLPNNGTVYLISKIYISKTKEETQLVVRDMAKTIKLGDITNGLIKQSFSFMGDGNTFFDFSSRENTWQKDVERILWIQNTSKSPVVFQENANSISDDDNKYNSFRGLVVFFENEKYNQYNNSIVFSKTCTTSLDSHVLVDDDYREFYYCSSEYLLSDHSFFMGLTAETSDLKNYNNSLYLFLNSLIPIVKKMEDFLQKGNTEEKRLKQLLYDNYFDFNQKADAELISRQQNPKEIFDESIRVSCNESINYSQLFNNHSLKVTCV